MATNIVFPSYVLYLFRIQERCPYFFKASFNNSFKRAHCIANNPNLLRFSNFMCTTFLSIVLTFSKDINECLRNTHSCHDNATCTNTEGSFYCTCNVGYSGTGTFCTGTVNIYLDRYDNDNKFIKKRRFEVILTSFSSSNDYRPLHNYK